VRDEQGEVGGGVKAGARAALAGGAERLLLLNNDTVLARDALGWLDDALDREPTAGIAGPRVVDLRHPEQVLSAGERHALSLLCVPRTLVRYRGPLDRPYAVSGLMGCAMLVTRACFEAAG